MLDQNTDRMWYVIGAVIVGAAIIFLVNSSFPQLFASVGDTFKDKTDDVSSIIAKIEPGGEPEEITVIKQISSVSMHGWDGSSFTKTEAHSIPELDIPTAFRIQAGGGTNNLKAFSDVVYNYDQVAGRRYVYTVSVKNIGAHSIKIYDNRNTTYILKPGQARILQFKAIGNAKWSHIQFRLQSISIDETVDALVSPIVVGYYAEKGDK